MDDLRRLSERSLLERLEHARLQLAAALDMPLDPGLIEQKDRDHLQDKWRAQIEACESEVERRRRWHNRLYVAIIALFVLWIVSCAVAVVADIGVWIAIIFYAGLGVALVVKLVAWIRERARK